MGDNKNLINGTNGSQGLSVTAAMETESRDTTLPVAAGDHSEESDAQQTNLLVTQEDVTQPKTDVPSGEGHTTLHSREGEITMTASEGDTTLPRGEAILPTREGDLTLYTGEGNTVLPTEEGDITLTNQNEEEIPLRNCNNEYVKRENDDEDSAVVEKISAIERLKTDAVYREKVLLSLSISWSFVVLGWVVGQFGPSFLDLQIITRTKLDKASGFLTSTSVGYLFGSLISGILYDRFNKTFLLIVYILFGVVICAVLPWCFWYELMMAVQFCRGFYSGGLDAGGNALMVTTWGSEGHSFMQMLHFAFAFGGIISPLVTAPFLLEKMVDINGDNSSLHGHAVIQSSHNSSINVSQISLYNFNDSTTVSSIAVSTTTSHSFGYKPEDSQLYIPFSITAAMHFSCAIPLLVMYLRARRRKRKNSIKKSEDKSKRISRVLPFQFKVLILCSVCLYFGLYCAVEDTFNAFLTTFCVKHLGWSKAEGSFATSMFWAAFGLGRFLGIWLIKLFHPDRMVCTFTVAVSVNFAVLLVFAQFLIDGGIWACAVFAGATMSINFPTMFCWTEEKLLPVSGKIASMFLISASAGTMINPIILGYLMDALSPMWFTYLLLGESIALIVVVFVLFMISRICESRFGSGCSYKNPAIEIKSEDDVANVESLLEAENQATK